MTSDACRPAESPVSAARGAFIPQKRDSHAGALTVEGRPVSPVELAARVAALGAPGSRVLLGLVGAPGAGKSTLGGELVRELPTGSAVVVPLDGFHLGQAVIAGTPLEHRKGAIDTFDVDGYVALLARLRADDGSTVYAPAYTRVLEEPIAASIAVPSAVRVVVTDGNYLLAADPAWRRVRDLLDEVWYLDTDDDLRLFQLVSRHEEAGKEPDDARRWAYGSDEANATLVRSTRDAADLVISRTT